jgi:putative colanic acid biosynthesis UDP-glucose lipid carrier transferase
VSVEAQAQVQALAPRAPRAALATQLLALLDPMVPVLVLLGCTAFFRVPFDGRYLILALLVLSLTFPGSTGRASSLGDVLREVATTWGMAVSLLFVIGWATQTLAAFDSRLVVVWLCVTPVAQLTAHLATRHVLCRLLTDERAQRVAVIAGGGTLARLLAESIASNPLLGIRVVGFFDSRRSERGQSTSPGNRLGAIDEIAPYVRTHGIDVVYITLPMASQPRILRLLDALHDTTTSIYFVPDIFVFDLIQARIDTISGLPVVSVCETPFAGLDGAVKRASDIILAAVILVLTAPLMLAIAAAVKLTSPGPVLFRQRRYGLDGRQIVVYKFRTMTVTEDGADIRQATRGDPRATAIGAILRRFSLDELPQFINVLQGRMSVVGPRPHAVAHNELYRKRIKGYMLRHKVKPGITGWAQVNGLRGETDTLDKMERRIAYDLEYLRNWSLRLDLSIVLRTVAVVLGARNAY